MLRINKNISHFQDQTPRRITVQRRILDSEVSSSLKLNPCQPHHAGFSSCYLIQQTGNKDKIFSFHLTSGFHLNIFLVFFVQSCILITSLVYTLPKINSKFFIVVSLKNVIIEQKYSIVVRNLLVENNFSFVTYDAPDMTKLLLKT